MSNHIFHRKITTATSGQVGLKLAVFEKRRLFFCRKQSLCNLYIVQIDGLFYPDKSHDSQSRCCLSLSDTLKVCAICGGLNTPLSVLIYRGIFFKVSKSLFNLPTDFWPLSDLYSRGTFFRAHLIVNILLIFRLED